MPQSPSNRSDADSLVSDTADLRKPRHREVFETLLGEIASGRFQPGDRLPTEAELAKTFSASRSTIARAMRDLKGRGLLHRQRGGGTRIARNDGKRVALFTPFAQSAAGLGYIGGQIHGHLSELASRRLDHLRLQVIGRTNGGDPLEKMIAAARALVDQGVAGVFYYPVELPKETAHYNQIVVEKLLAAGIAVLCVDRDITSFPERSKLPLVTYDNRRGGYLVTDHLIKKGCKRIVFIGSPYVSSAASDRMRGYRDALDDNDLPVVRKFIRPANLEDLDAAFCQALIEELKPDAILCKMDHYAALMGRHLLGMGLKVGQDIMLAGFDDEPFAELLPVPLTTIRFPADPFAEVCYERLLAQMANPSVPLPGQTLIDVELVVRESTGVL
jgi:DNA-binding LacI/PurR family transcriptional regulator/DNA-binding transcriptional regulator YhcF (GntR family)